MSKFSEVLKSKRLENDIKVTHLAKEIGVSHSYVSNIENNKRGIPSKELVVKLAEAVSPDDKQFKTELLYQAGYMSDTEYVYRFNNLDDEIFDLGWILSQNKQDVVCSLDVEGRKIDIKFNQEQKSFLLKFIENMLDYDGTISNKINEIEDYEKEHDIVMYKEEHGVDPETLSDD